MIKKRPTTPREVAAFTLFSMQEDGAWSDGALHQYLERAALSPRDTALATRLVYGVLQNRTMCDFYLAQYSKLRMKKIAPRVGDCLRMGVYQLTMLERVPAHAAVAETVSLIEKYAHATPRTVGFANALLRAVARAAESKTLPVLNCPDKESYYALRYSHPIWLVQALSTQFGQKQAGLICASNNEIAPLSLRICAKGELNQARESAMLALTEASFQPRAHPTLANVILCEGGTIASLPLFQNGDVTVQDGAGVVCIDVLCISAGKCAVDCCAAPGGKSFYMAETAEKVISCDIYSHKLDKINEGAARLGLHNIETRLADATKPQDDLVNIADCVLCDVPCSGVGVIRKKPELREKTEEETAALPALQQQILQNCAQYVKQGGVLVYSTCTILHRENEAIVTAFLAENPQFTAEPFTHPTCGICESGMVTLLPHLHETDGFFIAKLRRNA